MRSFTTEEATGWCEARGLKATTDRYLHYEPESPHCFTIGLEDNSSRVIALADDLADSCTKITDVGSEKLGVSKAEPGSCGIVTTVSQRRTTATGGRAKKASKEFLLSC